MLKKSVFVLLLITILFVTFACTTMVHTVGDGPQTRQSVEQRQWYAIFGLIPLNTVDTYQMANGAEHYEIKTEANIIDLIVRYFLGQFTISSRTITVTR